jgi:PhnB protein
MNNDIPTPSVSPFLFCRDTQASLDFLERAFGFTPGPLQDGHGQARLGDTLVFLSPPHPDSHMVPADQLGGVHSLVMVYVDDVDTLFTRARSAGAKIEYGPQDMPYGQREGGIRDLDGNLWCFATQL